METESMPSEMSVKHMSSRKTRVHVRKILDDLGIDNKFSINVNNNILTEGKDKDVTIKNWNHGERKKVEVDEKLEGELGLTVYYE